jgi:hypothetical protein
MAQVRDIYEGVSTDDVLLIVERQTRSAVRTVHTVQTEVFGVITPDEPDRKHGRRRAVVDRAKRDAHDKAVRDELVRLGVAPATLRGASTEDLRILVRSFEMLPATGATTCDAQWLAHGRRVARPLIKNPPRYYR